MTLTEYEIADLAATWQSTTTPTSALVITILSGYLIVAWLVGNKLTRAQVVLVNTLFVFFQFSMIAGWAMRWALSYKYSMELYSIDPGFYEAPASIPLIIFGAAMAVSVIACLKFMWDVRHPKKK